MLRRKKAFSRPKKPWQQSRMTEENGILKEYGLRKKVEIWRAIEVLRKWRETAKKIVGLAGDKKEAESKILLAKLQKYGIVDKESDVDDVLALSLRDVLEKRLQTVIYKKGMTITPKQARQLIVHNKVMVNSEKVNSPSYMVKVSDEISFVPGFTLKVQEKSGKPATKAQESEKVVEAEVTNG